MMHKIIAAAALAAATPRGCVTTQDVNKELSARFMGTSSDAFLASYGVNVK